MKKGPGDRPPSPRLCHVALRASDLALSESFYVDLLGFRVIWRPDATEVYLSSGDDNLALHSVAADPGAGPGRLDHVGFGVPSIEAVDAWFDFLSVRGVEIHAPPRTHRDGARSFYCVDPDGNRVQILYEPRLDPASRLDAPAGSTRGEPR